MIIFNCAQQNDKASNFKLKITKIKHDINNQYTLYKRRAAISNKYK